MLAHPVPTSQHGSDDAADSAESGSARVVLAALFSERYPAIGESHGLSAIAGVTQAQLSHRLDRMAIVDKVMTGIEDCADVADAIRAIDANVVGIAVQYGTFSVLKREYPRIRAAITARRPLIVFGGPLASYLGEEIISEVEPAAVVVEGEGDSAFPKLVAAWLGGTSFEGIENVRFKGTGGETHPARRALANLGNIVVPFRGHVAGIAHGGGQIYIESSRGCSWAACTFCLRGLTDVKGRPSEYRRFPSRRLLADIDTLRDLDIATVTFADEDFLGGSLDEVSPFIINLTSHLRDRVPNFTFDVSMTIDSVLGIRDTYEEADARRDLLHRLKAAGMRKVFLGIESGSAAQLRRYAKGHRPEHCAAAVRRLRDMGIVVEVGFIMFDPLCSLAEVRENLAFLRREDLVTNVSALANEMRLQYGSTYVRLLEREEKAMGREVFDRKVDHDTLSHSYQYADPKVSELTRTLRSAQAEARELVYPLKALTRYGDQGALAGSIQDVRMILSDVREAQFAGITACVDALIAGEQCEDAYDQHLVPALERAATGLLESMSCHGQPSGHPVVDRALIAADRVVSGSLRSSATARHSQNADMSEVDACDS